MAASPEQIQFEQQEIAAGRCPECHTNLMMLNNCPSCGFRNLVESKFCGNCGKGVNPVPTKASIMDHAEVHWGKDFHLTKATDKHKTEGDPWNAGVVHDPALFPDAVRRWKMLSDFDPSGTLSGAPAPTPVAVLSAGAEMPANASVSAKQ